TLRRGAACRRRPRGAEPPPSGALRRGAHRARPTRAPPARPLGPPSPLSPGAVGPRRALSRLAALHPLAASRSTPPRMAATTGAFGHVPSDRPLQLRRGAEVFAPAPLGRCDLLLAAGKIAAIAPALPELPPELAEVHALRGSRLIPGLLDAHVHLIGGGGEAGPSTRVPPVGLTQLSRAGITTVVG